MQPTDSPRDPVNVLAPKEPGAPAADDHGTSGPPAPEVIARGYEADTYDRTTVISVPVLVILFFVLAFGTVSIIFYFIAYPPGDPRAHPGAAERNKRPLNERLAAIGRNPEVNRTREQPRVEPLKLRSGDARAITRPELPEGNSPELRPEDLRVNKDQFPALYKTGDNKLGIDKSMALGTEQLKALFPVQPNASAPTGSTHRPTGSNAGQGFGESVAVVPAAPKLPEAKKDEKKNPPDPKGGKQ